MMYSIRRLIVDDLFSLIVFNDDLPWKWSISSDLGYDDFSMVNIIAFFLGMLVIQLFQTPSLFRISVYVKPAPKSLVFDIM